MSRSLQDVITNVKPFSFNLEVPPTTMEAIRQFGKELIGSSNIAHMKSEPGDPRIVMEQNCRVRIRYVAVLTPENIERYRQGGMVDLSNIDNFDIIRESEWILISGTPLVIQIEVKGYHHTFTFDLDEKMGRLNTNLESVDLAGNPFKTEGGFALTYDTTNPGKPLKKKEKPNGEVSGRRLRPGQSPWDRIGRR